MFILENASAGMALEGWSCERLAQEFPDAKMRREYDWVKNPEALVIGDQKVSAKPRLSLRKLQCALM